MKELIFMSPVSALKNYSPPAIHDQESLQATDDQVVESVNFQAPNAKEAAQIPS